MAKEFQLQNQIPVKNYCPEISVGYLNEEVEEGQESEKSLDY